MSVAQEINDSYVAGKLMGRKQLGEEILEIIYSDITVPDGEVIDQIVELLKQYKLYKETNKS